MKKTTLILWLVCLNFFFSYGQTEIKKEEVKQLKNVLLIGYNFYTFDNTGAKSLYPTPFSLYYRHYIPIHQGWYYELSWNYFDAIAYQFGFQNIVSNEIYTQKFHTFHTLRCGIGTTIIPNRVSSSIGICYKYGSAGELRNIYGVGILPVTFRENSSGLYIAINYQWQLGKKIVLEPTARYEHYFLGVRSHYMLGLNVGYKF